MESAERLLVEISTPKRLLLRLGGETLIGEKNCTADDAEDVEQKPGDGIPLPGVTDR
jgi:hypothetical protein